MSFWEKVNNIFMEENKLSLGRVTFLIVFGMSVRTWWMGNNIPETMLQVLFALLGYNIFKSPLKAGSELVVSKAKEITARCINKDDI